MIVIMSLWRNDAERDLEERVRHLLSKSSALHELRWLWVTGDNDDETTQRLGEVSREILGGVACAPGVMILDIETGIVGEDIPSRRRRSAATATEMFRWVDQHDAYAVLHESDLQSDTFVVDRLLAVKAAAEEPVAGWPTIELERGYPQFYDIWAFRETDGRPFHPHRPKPRSPFEVSSFGSVWLAPASMVRNRVLDEECVVGLCRQWRAEGHHLWCDPRVPIVQPISLWQPQ